MADDVTIRRRKLTEYRPDPQNANLGTERGQYMLDRSVEQSGATRSLVASVDDVVPIGNHAMQALYDAGITDVLEIETDGRQVVVVKRKDWTRYDAPEVRRAAALDNRTAQVNLTWDAEQLLADMQAGVDLSDMFMPDELDALIGATAQDTAELLADLDGAAFPVGVHDVPDALWATDNEWGVPVLDDLWQADAVDLPVNVYGASGRKTKMQGTYHFYTDDYRFEGLWSDPTPIVNSGCVNVVEPNYSTNIQMPRAIVLWHTYRKRWLSRYWQSKGIRIFVDLDVNAIFDDVNLLGVPEGWRAYACYMRKSDHDPEELLRFLDVATTRAGSDDVLMLVVGGESDVQALCREHKQCVWVPSFEQKFYRNYRQKTQGG